MAAIHGRYVVCITVLLLAQGCGSRAPGTPMVPRPPQAGDLRFQQVDAPSTANGYVGFEFTLVSAGLGQSFGNMSGTPLMVGDVCNAPTGSPFDCAWGFSVFFLPANVSGLTVSYQSGNNFQNLAPDLSALARPDTVITSIDLRPASNTYAISSMQTSQTTGFDASQLTVLPSDLQATAALEGAKSRVITALSFNAGQLVVFSYGWQSDTTTVYDTNVMTGTIDAIATQAANLAAAGYILTALGGNSADGFVLVGTKVHGDTAPRPLRVVPNGSQDTQLWNQGYAIVGLIVNSNGNTTTWIGEK